MYILKMHSLWTNNVGGALISRLLVSVLRGKLKDCRVASRRVLRFTFSSKTATVSVRSDHVLLKIRVFDNAVADQTLHFIYSLTSAVKEGFSGRLSQTEIRSPLRNFGAIILLIFTEEAIRTESVH